MITWLPFRDKLSKNISRFVNWRFKNLNLKILRWWSKSICLISWFNLIKTRKLIFTFKFCLSPEKSIRSVHLACFSLYMCSSINLRPSCWLKLFYYYGNKWEFIKIWAFDWKHLNYDRRIEKKTFHVLVVYFHYQSLYVNTYRFFCRNIRYNARKRQVFLPHKINSISHQ